MELGLRGRTAIVTGASRGIGRAIMRALHAEGVGVVAISQDEQTLTAAARVIGAEPAEAPAPIHPIAADLGLRSEVERVAEEAVRRLGHVDILVNNAARATTGDFFAMSDEQLQEAWRVKALGYVRLVRAVAPGMVERGSGSIINVVGNTARTPAPDFIVGSMVNAALINFTRGIARELARSGVRVNAVSPGWTLTERQRASFELQAAARSLSPEDVERVAARAIPAGRLTTPDEVARVVLLLASDLAPSVIGADVLLEGGATPSI